MFCHATSISRRIERGRGLLGMVLQVLYILRMLFRLYDTFSFQSKDIDNLLRRYLFHSCGSFASIPRKTARKVLRQPPGLPHHFNAPPVRYSVTRVSKKFFSFERSTASLIHGKGFATLNCGGSPTRSRRRSATYSMYCLKPAAFMPKMPSGKTCAA